MVDAEAKPAQVCAAQAEFAGSAEQVEVWVRLSGPRYDFPGSVGAVVVDDQYVDIRFVFQDLVDERQDVLGLVISR